MAWQSTAPAGPQNRGKVDLADAVQLLVGAGHDDLHRTFTDRMIAGKVCLASQQFAAGKVPILDEHSLQVGHRWPDQAHVGVAPVTEYLRLAEIFIADVHAAAKGNLAVGYEDFAVVAQVDLGAPPQWIEQGKERLAPPAGRAQLREVPAMQAMRAHRVVDEPHLHASTCFFGQQCQDGSPGFIGLQDKVFQVNMMLGSPNGFQLCVEGRLALVVERDPVADRGRESVESQCYSSQPGPTIAKAFFSPG